MKTLEHMVYKYTNTNFILSQFVHNKYNINIYIFTTITRILKALGQSGKNPGISDQGISGTNLLVMQRKNMICVIGNFNGVSERMVLFFYA